MLCTSFCLLYAVALATWSDLAGAAGIPDECDLVISRELLRQASQAGGSRYATCCAGLLGGAVYVNAFTLISKEVAPQYRQGGVGWLQPGCAQQVVCCMACAQHAVRASHAGTG